MSSAFVRVVIAGCLSAGEKKRGASLPRVSRFTGAGKSASSCADNYLMPQSSPLHWRRSAGRNVDRKVMATVRKTPVVTCFHLCSGRRVTLLCTSVTNVSESWHGGIRDSGECRSVGNVPHLVRARRTRTRLVSEWVPRLKIFFSYTAIPK